MLSYAEGPAWSLGCRRLDDAAASAIMSLLHLVATEGRVAVVCTIHQPSAKVYSGLEQLLLLSRGQTAYYGPADGLVTHVTSLGRPTPGGISVAEHALDLVNSDFTGAEAVEQVLAAWRKSAPPPPKATQLLMPSVPARASFVKSLAVLLRRQLELYLKDPIFFKARIGLTFFLSLSFTLVFFNTRNRKQKDVLPLFYYAYLLSLIATFTIFPVLLCMCRRWLKFGKEIRQQMYGPVAYYTASSLIDLLVTFIGGFVSTSVAYTFLNLPAKNFLPLWLVLSTWIFWMDSNAELCSFAGQEFGIFFLGNSNTLANLSAGTFISRSKIVWPLRVFGFIFPGWWTNNAVIHLIFTGGNDFGGVFPATTATSEGRAALAAGSQFVCPGSDECYGADGRDVLATFHVRARPRCHEDRTHSTRALSMHRNTTTPRLHPPCAAPLACFAQERFEVAEPDSMWSHDLGYSILIVVAFRLLGYAVCVWSVQPRRAICSLTLHPTLCILQVRRMHLELKA